MPITGSQKAYKYALSGVARSGTTRSGYHSPKGFISIGGVNRRENIKVDTVRIVDTLNQDANIASADAAGFVPVVGEEVIITLGSINNSTRIFAGQILSYTQRYEGVPSNVIFGLNLIDYTWALSKLKVTKKYTNQSATAIALDIIANFTSGFTVVHVAEDLPVVDEVTFTNQDVASALTHLASRIGGYWYVDYDQDIHFFVEDETYRSSPQTIELDSPNMRGFTFSQDLGQFVTRCIGIGGGSNSLTDIEPGETILPVVDPVWYSATGGYVISGPQRISYTSVDQGGGGTLVGAGASPSSSLVLELAAGSGIETGEHDYAATFVTAAGESLPSPISTIDVGFLAAPSTAPTAGSPTAGSGVTTGDHYYAVTFVTAAGETTSSPESDTITTGPVTSGEIPAPSTAPTAATNNTVGNHLITVKYAVTFTNGAGETTAGPQATREFILGTSNPNASGTSIDIGTGNISSANSYDWFMTAVNSEAEETTIGTGVVGGAGADFNFQFSFASPDSAGVSSYKFYRRIASVGSPRLLGQTAAGTDTTFIDNIADNSGGAIAPTVNNTYGSVSLTNIPIGPSGTTGRKVYATEPGGSQLKLLATISNNTTTTATDTNPGNLSRLGANVPVTNTTSTTTNFNQVPLSNLPIGGALVTSRKIYRTAAGGSQLKLLTTIADNVTTSFLDTIADGSLGADIPVSNTAAANRVSVSSIPVGPTGVTQRKVYRTEAGLSQLKLLTTIADNTTTTYADSTADAGLGANVPVVDTSGLSFGGGVVVAGATSMPVAFWSGENPTSGWAVVGNGEIVIRYTGVSSNTTLTGIPATGPGSITSSIQYGASITAAPQLRGVPASGAGAVAYAIPKGEEINVLVIEDDVAGQALLASIVGGDGVREEVVSDERLSIEEIQSRCRAFLTARAQVLKSISYQTHDLNANSGAMVPVDIDAPWSILDEFRIQQVTIEGIEKSGDDGLVYPWRQVEASTERFSFEDLLRRIRG